MSEFKIEKNVPIPLANAVRTKYPLAEMGNGDSFVFPSAQANLVRQSVQYWGRKLNMKFSIRREADKTKYRIWRIS